MAETHIKKSCGISSSTLHIIAMIFMLCDHVWATLVPGHNWLTYIGRLAFPIFAFMIVEGYFHTHDLGKYVKRLLICAVISEIPFNLMYGSSVFYIIHQNVIWTFLIGIFLIWLNEKARLGGKLPVRILTGIGTVILGMVSGFVFMVDYFGVGVLTVLVFYFFREKKWWCLLGQIIILYYLNVEVLSGYYFEIDLFGHMIPIVQQGLSLFALIPIWLYRGEKGIESKAFRYICYGFYPVHMIVLCILRTILI